MILTIIAKKLGGVMAKNIITVLGGISSGKSSFAEQRSLLLGEKRTYIATNTITDEEMRLKVKKHVQRRADRFTTVENFDSIDKVISSLSTNVCMIDCVSGMLSNLMYNSKIDFETCPDKIYEDFANYVISYVKEILSSMQKKNISFVIVTNELGLSTVNMSKYVRRYVSLHGEINQMFCGVSDEVYFMLAGIATKIK